MEIYHLKNYTITPLTHEYSNKSPPSFSQKKKKKNPSFTCESSTKPLVFTPQVIPAMNWSLFLNNLYGTHYH